ncbi:MAG: methyltransferase domain-containing protein [Cyanobacteria bacterium P01_H01_bin.74]
MSPLLKQYKRYRRIHKKSQYLQNLVAVYKSPWFKTRGVFKNEECLWQKHRLVASHHRFQKDCQAMLSYIKPLMGWLKGEALENTEENPDALLLNKSLPPVLDSVQWQRLSQLTTFFEEGTQLSLKDEDESQTEAFYFSSPYRFNDKQLDPAIRFEKQQALRTLYMTPHKNYATVCQSIARAILITVFWSLTTPRVYDLDWLSEIVPLLKSRYCDNYGQPLTNLSDGLLTALWLTTDTQCQETATSPVVLDKLPQALQQLLQNSTDFQPERKKLSHNFAAVIPEYSEEFEALNAIENPKRFTEICGLAFERINTATNASFENRDISLIYGYENNHHLLLRRFIDLIATNQLTPDDSVLVLGPRYPDEIDFFRKNLGLKNTIGLDLLKCTPDKIIQGDMHRMPFADRTFKLIYGANVFEYAYDLRQLAKELIRVTVPSGFVSGICRRSSAWLPCPTGRTDVVSIEALLALFYQTKNTIVAADPGLTTHPEKTGIFPSFLLKINQ